MPQEKPILFSRDVRAILDKSNPKTQTRRVIRPQPVWEELSLNGEFRHRWLKWVGSQSDRDLISWRDGDEIPYKLIEDCPYGQPGDLLWVREAYNPGLCPERSRSSGYRGCVYRADDAYARYVGGWTPSIHMPRRHSRLTLEVVSVRVELLQNITERDICAELGAPPKWTGPGAEPYERDLRLAFAHLWDSTNKRCGHSWQSNPYVWAIGFEIADA